MNRYLVLIVLLALALRGLTAIGLGEEVQEVSGTFDQIAYDMLAQRVVAGDGFSFPIEWYPFIRADTPTAVWSFLYPLYLAGVYTVFGHHPLVARLIQVLISLIGIWLIYRLGKRLFGASAGLAGAALAACYAYLILFNASLMTQTFYILCVLASLELAIGLAQKPGWMRWLLLGIVLGLGVLFRQSLLLFTPLLFGWIWWKSDRAEQPATKPRTLLGLALVGAVIALFVLPWTVRNYLVFDDFLLLNSNGGYWFYSSNHPDQGTNFDPTFKAVIPDSMLALGEPALDRALYRSGLEFVIADPGRFLLLSLSRLNDYFWLLPSDDSTALSNLSRLLSFGLYLPFMLYGLYLSRSEWRWCLPLYLYVACDALFCLASWSAPRYRLPSDAILMVFAGFAASTVASRLRFFVPKATKAG